jgi:hypothetical protein
MAQHLHSSIRMGEFDQLFVIMSALQNMLLQLSLRVILAPKRIRNG